MSREILEDKLLCCLQRNDNFGGTQKISKTQHPLPQKTKPMSISQIIDIGSFCYHPLNNPLMFETCEAVTKLLKYFKVFKVNIETDYQI